MVESQPEPPAATTPAIPFGEAFRVWVRVAIYSFGGPAGQMAVMYRILVQEKRWISESRFLHALNYAMLLPGPEAQQLATYVGWLLHRVPGGLVAGTLFVLPGFVSILALSILYAGFQELSLVQGLFYGLKPAVMAIVVEAVLRIGRRALRNGVMVGLAALAFVAIYFFDVPFPAIVLGAGLIGYAGARFWPDRFLVLRAPEPGRAAGNEVAMNGDPGAARDEPAVYAVDDRAPPPAHTRPSTRRAVRVLAVCLALWFSPLLALILGLGPEHVFSRIGLFFSQTAVVTFGGAYAVLAYVAQEAVGTFGWLQPGEMLDGLGMAETTPGPLIQVVQFVGFMGAYRHPGQLTPLTAGVLGAILTTWVTFVPCFLWIFLGGPYIEHLRGNRALSGALAGITAAVVGVILNLAVWFSLQTLFAAVAEVYMGPLRLYLPRWATLDWVALGIAVAAFVALFRFKTGMLTTLAGAAGAGLLYFLLFVA